MLTEMVIWQICHANWDGDNFIGLSQHAGMSQNYVLPQIAWKASLLLSCWLGWHEQQLACKNFPPGIPNGSSLWNRLGTQPKLEWSAENKQIPRQQLGPVWTEVTHFYHRDSRVLHQCLWHNWFTVFTKWHWLISRSVCASYVALHIPQNTISDFTTHISHNNCDNEKLTFTFVAAPRSLISGSVSVSHHSLTM